MKLIKNVFLYLWSNVIFRLFIALALFTAVIMGIKLFKFLPDLFWLRYSLIALMTVATCCSLIIIVIAIWQYRNADFVETSYLSLDYWIDKNDIGNASNLVKSLSKNKNIKEYFHKELDKVREENKQNTKQFKITSKYELLVKAIPEIVDLIDKETEDSLIFIKTYLEFEPKNKSVNEKILNSLIGIGFVGLILSSLKYGIDLLIKKETALIGQYIITWTILITIIISIIGWILYRKKTREENARKFLQLVFKAIEEKK
ncbi:hypothetical protein CUM48_04265 [Enterococcus faecalis]|uniref:hypothetical protein n=1 Tax=Enterococcus faecalis TaxID=1351 RepID=UPI000CF2E6F9|nr:hypothetical protein [Enterococcus faecalis]EIQ7116632.1 hypothetical protein [Enterococcus faecalis]PQD81470.1 hypothetical protein CUM48_04265 [Enterococcus faecalis]